MYELAKIPLNNDQDLILAHKRAMQLGELAGLPLVNQTTFATAVSELLQNVTEQGSGTFLTLGITSKEETVQCIAAKIEVGHNQIVRQLNGRIKLISHLVDDFRISEAGQESEVLLYIQLPANQSINDVEIDNWKSQFTTEPIDSLCDEIKRKNSQLQEMAGQLRTSEKHNQVLADALPLMIFKVNAEGKLLYANEWLEKYTGESMALLNEMGWAAIIHEDDIASVSADWAKTASTGIPLRLEIRIKNLDTGDYVWHLATAKALRNEKGEILYWIGFLVEIQAQKMIEQTLKENQELIKTKQELERLQHGLKMNIGELNRSNQELAEFAYVASHDLQEPLRKIQSFGTLLVEQFSAELSPLAQDMIRRMRLSAERMNILIKDILAYSRLNTQQQPFRQVDLDGLVREILGDLEINIREKGARIDVEPLPAIVGSSLQLRQLFQNLLSNALKFITPGQSPKIRIFANEVSIFEIPATMRQQEPSYLAISVEDNGIGFDERYHNRIFQLFQRLHGKDQYPGTGIGLTICKKVAEMHGGTIAATSQPGHGATFTVYLPYSIAA